MDSPSKSQPPSGSGQDERFLGESMLRRITSFGSDRNPSQTKHWMPDSAGNIAKPEKKLIRLFVSHWFLGKECYNCQEKFTPFRRRHHCGSFSIICHFFRSFHLI